MKTEDVQRRLKKELNQARLKLDPVYRPVITAPTIVHHYNTSTETVLLIFPFLQTNIKSQMRPSSAAVALPPQHLWYVSVTKPRLKYTVFKKTSTVVFLHNS